MTDFWDDLPRFWKTILAVFLMAVLFMAGRYVYNQGVEGEEKTLDAECLRDNLSGKNKPMKDCSKEAVRKRKEQQEKGKTNGR